PRMAAPIGLTSWDWLSEGEVAGAPINYGGSNLMMNALDHARFGHLYVNAGKWNGEQILPAGWVKKSTRNQVPLDLPPADNDRADTEGRGIYGYNWWIINKGKDAPVAGAFTSGLNHNVCLVVPEWDMVIVRMGVDGNPEGITKHAVYSEVLRRLAPGVTYLYPTK
ncbi:MAG: hypothetical protein AAFN92_17885, partial [Bacteroidota bacterium]